MPNPAFGTLSDKGEPSDWYLPVAPGSGQIAAGKLCRAILCSEDGALNLTDASGSVRANIPVQKGYNPLQASVINNPSAGSAPGVVVALF